MFETGLAVWLATSQSATAAERTQPNFSFGYTFGQRIDSAYVVFKIGANATAEDCIGGECGLRLDYDMHAAQSSKPSFELAQGGEKTDATNTKCWLIGIGAVATVVVGAVVASSKKEKNIDRTSTSVCGNDDVVLGDRCL